MKKTFEFNTENYSADAGNLNLALGVSDDRATEIGHTTHEILAKKEEANGRGTAGDILEAVLEVVKTPEEFLVGYAIAWYNLGRKQANPLQQLFERAVACREEDKDAI